MPRMRTPHQLRRDHQAQSIRPKARPRSHDEIAKTKQRFVLSPRRDFEKSVRANQEIKMVASVGSVLEVAHRVNRVEKLVRAEILAGFGERRHEVRVLGACQRHHREAVRERRKVVAFMWWTARWDEVDFVEVEPAVGGARDGQMAVVDWVERSAKQRNAARMVARGGARKLGGRQWCSVKGACSTCSVAESSSASRTGRGKRWRASAMWRANSWSPYQ